MSKIALLIRYISFCLFFAIGAGSIALSFLAPELLENYKSIDELNRTEIGNIKLEELVDTYDKQIETARKDPDILKRLEKKTFGTQTPQEYAAFPQASDELLQFAKRAMKETEDAAAPPSKFRKYIEQSAKKKTRKGLFYSGAALILITFVCFAAPKQKPKAPSQE